MADSFPGGVLVFDAANRTAVKMIAKTWLRSAKIQDVGAYFAVSDAKSEISRGTADYRLQAVAICWAIMIFATLPSADYSASLPEPATES